MLQNPIDEVKNKLGSISEDVYTALEDVEIVQDMLERLIESHDELNKRLDTIEKTLAKLVE